MSDPRDSLCFALDVSEVEEAERMVALLAPHVGIFKIGLQLFLLGGPELVCSIHALGAEKIFLDLKFLDIPRTVYQARRSAARMPVSFLSVHCESLANPPPDSGEPDDQEPMPQLLGVTILTSLGPSELKLLGYRPELSLTDIVLMRAELARKAGCAGVVCSGREVEAIRERLGPDVLIVTPGIRPSWAAVAGDDQSRVLTAREAIRAGADILVVGRPIRTAPDPGEAAQKLLEEIAQGRTDRP